MKLILFILFAISCGVEKEKPAIFFSEKIIEKQMLYLDLLKEKTGEDWYHKDDCDALLFNSLLYFSGARWIDISKAESEPGKWHRTPAQDCYETGRSRSQISRDMLAGLFFTLNKQGFKDLFEYGLKRNWKMGEGPIDTVFLSLNFINTIGAVLNKTPTPEAWVDPIKDHQRHVSALNILFRSMVNKSLPKDALTLIKTFKDRDRDNILYTYILYRYGLAPVEPLVEALLDESKFPSTRLPESRDRCSRWLWERDHNKQPCPERSEVHSGGDFLFIARLLGGDF